MGESIAGSERPELIRNCPALRTARFLHEQATIFS